MKYIKVICNCEEVITVAASDAWHIDEMIETIRDWETISQEQLHKIEQLELKVAQLQDHIREITNASR